MKHAQIIRAEADAQAAKTYADAFGKDPDFYEFYRAMQSYRDDVRRQWQGEHDGRLQRHPCRRTIAI